ncbi:MAG: hypothetical protein AAGK37_09835 [Pseudomonadota bacterium]
MLGQRSESMKLTGVGMPGRGRGAMRAVLAFSGFDRLPGLRGLVPVSMLRVGDRIRCADGGQVGVAAVLRQTADTPCSGIALYAGALAAADTAVPDDQMVRIEGPMVAKLCGYSRALVRAGDLPDAGLGRPVALAAGPRYHVVLDRPAFLPLNGLALLPFIPWPTAVGGLDRDTREELFVDEPRFRYPAAADSLDPGLPRLNARETAIAVAQMWTQGAEAGKISVDPKQTLVNSSCVPGTSGPSPLSLFSGRSRHRRTTF